MKTEGNDKLTLQTPVGAQDGSLTLKTDGGTLSGSLANSQETVDFTGGAVDGGTVSFCTKIPTPIGKLKAYIMGAVEGDHFSGKDIVALGPAAWN